MTFYPGGADEWEEDEACRSFFRGKPKLCDMRCTSRSERLQLALLDQEHRMGAAFLNVKEKSFLKTMSRDERCRMFSLTDEEIAVLDGAKEGEPIKMPSLPSSSSSGEKKTRNFHLSEPVEHPVEATDIIMDTVSRFFSLALSTWDLGK